MRTERQAMFQDLRPALVLLVIFTLLTGIVYPLAVTGIAQVIFPHQANGSLIYQRDQLVGSELIGQPFDAPDLFWCRPSAASYNGGASTGSNLGPTNPALADNVKARVTALGAPSNTEARIPVDLATASASGLDPHISPAAALWQIPRVAKARGMKEDELRRIVEQHVETRTWGVFGEPRVNVLLINRALHAR